MASPRRRWHKTPDSVWEEAFSNDVAAFLWRLSGYLNSRWASDRITHEQAATCVVTGQILCQLAGTQSVVKARRTASLVAGETSVRFEQLEKHYRLEWHKWAELQGSQSQVGEAAAQKPPPPKKKKKKKKQGDSLSDLAKTEADAAAGGKPSRERRGLTKAPKQLPDDARDRIRAMVREELPHLEPRLTELWKLCRDWHWGNGRTRRDWEAVFRNWLRNTHRYEPERGKGTLKAKLDERTQTRRASEREAVEILRRDDEARQRRVPAGDSGDGDAERGGLPEIPPRT